MTDESIKIVQYRVFPHLSAFGIRRLTQKAGSRVLRSVVIANSDSHSCHPTMSSPALKGLARLHPASHRAFYSSMRSWSRCVSSSSSWSALHKGPTPAMASSIRIQPRPSSSTGPSLSMSNRFCTCIHKLTRVTPQIDQCSSKQNPHPTTTHLNSYLGYP